MADMSSATAKALSCGQELHGFVVTDVQDLPEIDGRAVLMRHKATGAPLMWLANDDANKSFSITFKTPPRDSTGVFHILEHSVLCGSDLYPVKEPFVNLLKSSMQTFLNALTFSDKTMYPVASTNEKDLLNLMSVYLDAVFFPQLYSKRAIFEQEGWHYEVEGEGQARRLVTNGVVLNEMRGAMSDPDEVALAGLNEALFPDNAYGFESGGNPEVIPTLTYEDYLDTHARHYNMANSHIVLYGDISLDDELELIDGFAGRAQNRNLATNAGPNPLAMQAPCVNLHATRTMQTSPDNACVLLGYVVGTYRDRERMLACEILSDALMGSNEAPLKKKVLESELGFDVDCFVFDGLQQPYVAFELRGAQPGCAEEFEKLIESELARMAEEGVPRAELAAALDACDFNLRERDSGMADGVALAINAMCGWLYDDTMPCDYLRYEDAMANLRAGLETTYWEDLVRDLFVTSEHHARCELLALEEDDADEGGRGAAEPDQACEAAVDLDEVERAAEALHCIQDAPDSPEALATLPRLSVADAQDAPLERPWQIADAPLPCLHYDLETRRIDYTYHYFPLDALSWDELPLASLACSLLGKLQTSDYTAPQLDLLVESRLGRLGFSTHVTLDAATGAPRAYLVASACAISENLADLAHLPSHIWGQTDFGDIDKIRTVLQQQKLDSEQGFASSGHSYALSRALGYTDDRRRLAQHFGGVDYYRFVCDLLARWDEASQTLPARLADVCGRVFRSGDDHHSFTGSASDMHAYWELAKDLDLSARPEEGARLVIPADSGRNEAFIVPTDVCFVAKALSGTMAHNDFSGAWNVAQKAVNYEHLWNEIRVKGGAYGCGLRCDVQGELGYYTYRDPNLDASLSRMDATAPWLEVYNPTPQDMDGYIVSTVAAHDAPKRPHQVARRNDTLFLAGRTLAWREQVRREELDCTTANLQAMAPALQAVADRGRVCVFGSKDIICASQVPLDVIDLIAR